MMASPQLLHAHVPSLPPVVPGSHARAHHPHPGLLHPPYRQPHRREQAVEAVLVAQFWTAPRLLDSRESQHLRSSYLDPFELDRW